MPKNVCFLFLIVCIGISCNRTDRSLTRIQADSLTHVCDTLVYNLDVADLRANSLKLMELAGKDRAAYLDARSYWFVSYFNEKEYEKCAGLISDVLVQEKDLDEYPGIKSTYMYTRSRCYQYMKDYDRAKTSFGELLHYDTKLERDSKQTVSNLRIGLWQYLNCFLLSGTGKDGIEKFERLGDLNNCLMSDSCTRSRLIYLGYLYTLGGRENDALKCAEKALAIAPSGSSDILYTEYVYINAIYAYSAKYETERIDLLNKAFDLASSKNDQRLVQWSMNLLANLYIAKTEYYKAHQLYLRALELFEKSGDKYGETYIRIDLLQLYDRIGMDDRFEENLKNIYESVKSEKVKMLTPFVLISDFNKKMENPQVPKDVLSGIINQGLVYAKETQRDDIFKAFETCRLLVQLRSADSAAVAAKKLEAFYKKPVPDIQSVQSRYIIFYLGKYYLETGHDQNGRIWMSKYIAESPHANNSVKKAYAVMMNSYIRTGDYRELAEMTPRYTALCDSLERLSQIAATTASVIRYDTEKKVQENQLLTSQLDAEKRRVQLISVSLAAVLVFAAGLILQLRNRHKIVKLQRNLIGHQREQLQKLMDEMKQTAPPQITEPEEGLLENLRTSFITAEQENSFRKLFSEMYPHFLYKLRKHFPGVTKSEELLAMFLLLKQSNEEIAGILGISADSVKKSRYRLRKKIGLTTDQSLEEKINSLV